MLLVITCLIVACSGKDMDMLTSMPSASEFDAGTLTIQTPILTNQSQTPTPVTIPTQTPSPINSADSPKPSVSVQQLSPAEKYLAETSDTQGAYFLPMKQALSCILKTWYNNIKKGGIIMSVLEKIKLAANDGLELSTVLFSAEDPKALVQIIHGAVEHKNRYFDFAEFL
jgi:hypothetical protein